MPYYFWYEMNHAAVSPARATMDMAKLYFRNPLNPLSQTQAGRSAAAWCEMFERMTRRYGKPAFGIDTTLVSGRRVPIREEVVWKRPFCELRHFKKVSDSPLPRLPKLLIVAPMSGHYATLLRGTVEDMLPNHDVYITDWTDARMVPLSDGTFDLDDYIDYVINILHKLGGDTHMMAVCQPSVPVLAAVALMNERSDPYAPLSMTLMGGPIDTRVNPTAVNKLAEERDLDWFQRNAVMKVPFPHAGFMRDVYPGFLQLSGFMSMNLDRHMSAHTDLFMHMVEGDGDSAEKHRDFYDEYMAVMDLTAEFYLQTVEVVFIEHNLPKRTLTHRGNLVDCSKITQTALMTIEGERDDISGLGQTEAAQGLCSSLPENMKVHYVQPRVGHYGVFNGSRFRAEIAPRIKDFILSNDPAVRRARDTRKKIAPPKIEPVAAAPAAKVAPKPAPKAGPKAAAKPAVKAAAKSKLNGRAPAESAAVAQNVSMDKAKPAPRVAAKAAAKPAARMSKAPTKSPAKASARTVANTAAKTAAKAPAKPASKAPAPKASATKASASKAPTRKAAPKQDKRKLGASPFIDKPLGKADDLKVISGVGPKLENLLNELGVYHYWQVAQWTPKHIEAVDEKLTFKGRIARDNWVGQAKSLVK